MTTPTDDLATTIREKTTVLDALPLAATAKLLCRASTKELQFDPEHLVLYSSTPPSETTARYLYALAKSAQDGAYALACSSILVGTSNESDDTGDVAFWLGVGDFASASKVLEALGLSGNSVEGTELELTSELNRALESMKGLFSFRIGMVDDSSRMVFFQVGEIGGGWGGLVGAGVWT
ncbi:hypothetical protein BDN70DRAFT_928341 [Pholiota conissans]|uniref:Uncharacterized protein n=1 Tax=Pholiota conissans TaxID=109636 RepID=A0A9P6D606_9AGAR|nr:hypothetical protein BDN70DRAFT_928341 [Pholiota conissans]